MIPDPDGATIVVSPHLDDAVLSAFHVLADDRPTLIVDLFTGVPPAGTLTIWDRVCGYTSSAETMERRIHEEYAVLATLPTCAGWLVPRLESVARDELGEEDPTIGELAGEITSAARRLLDDRVARILAPLGGSDRPNRDHTLARDAALALRWTGVPVELYADFPHVCKARRAWPVELLSGIGTPRMPVEVTINRPRWVSRLPREGIVDPLWPTTVRVLDDDERARKEATARLYETQFDALDRRLRTKGIVSDPDLYGVEVLVEPAAR